MNDPFPSRVREAALRIDQSGPEALGGLFDLTALRLVRFAATVTRNQHDAEDAVQATLVRIADRPSLLARSDEPWAYLLRMVRNDSLVILRRRKRWGAILSLADLLTRRDVDEVQREESHREVWAAIRGLPTDQAEVVVLKIWESMTFAQIAAVLEISPATAASRYRYALEKLTVKLADPVEEPTGSPEALGAHARCDARDASPKRGGS
jgi:RNA polymerase sigma-70 factor (ECF subfamily)